MNDAYTTVLVGALVLTIVWEVVAERRPQPDGRLPRWSVNTAVFGLNLLLVALLVPLGSVAMAMLVEERGLGLAHALALPGVVAFPLAILALDLADYAQHRVLHRAPWLWRLHRMHHTDTDCDVTTSFRFHPLETLVGVAVEFSVIAAVGAPALAVAAYRLGRVVLSTVVHGNVTVPSSFESLLRLVFVTPDLHRVHHSRTESEQNRNFSGGLIWWDRLFGSYLADPADGHQKMELGVRGWDARRARSLGALLADPLVGPGS